METVEIKCENCGKRVYVFEYALRKRMFCTLGCMDAFNETSADSGISN